MSVRQDICGTPSDLYQFFVLVAYGCGSVLQHVDDRPHRLSPGRGFRGLLPWHCCPFTEKNKHGDATSLDMYRGTRLLPIIWKIFELVSLDLFNDFLTTESLQFAFKRIAVALMHFVHFVNLLNIL